VTPVINEIQTKSSTSSTDQFIELFNPGSTAYSLSGHSLVYRSATGTTDIVLVSFTATQSISGGGYFLMAPTGYPGPAVPDASYSTPSLASSGGGVALRDPGSNILDSVGYGNATNAFVMVSPAPAPSADDSIERFPDGTNNHNNSVDFIVTTTPTPRATNVN
jgi:hypothetical protein